MPGPRRALCGQKALCALVPLAGITTSATSGEVAGLAGDKGEKGKKKSNQEQPKSLKHGLMYLQGARVQVGTKPGGGRGIRTPQSHKLLWIHCRFDLLTGRKSMAWARLDASALCWADVPHSVVS